MDFSELRYLILRHSVLLQRRLQHFNRVIYSNIILALLNHLLAQTSLEINGKEIVILRNHLGPGCRKDLFLVWAPKLLGLTPPKKETGSEEEQKSKLKHIH